MSRLRGIFASRNILEHSAKALQKNGLGALKSNDADTVAKSVFGSRASAGGVADMGSRSAPILKIASHHNAQTSF